ncbi:C4-dicarboxylate ABC transporter permease [Vibrio breoganii]|uniref:C4-dicarboxylate ABC transporter permease n=1 Tax=Vibrio breoganii TaxID=553239 RepID=A0AAN0XVT2_9VIBR|nr:tripartite tricarboxylate transporter permease [Vibrio breoganii]ANO33568.1 C4-dicarboxylate ABC transporter permease [Vibrio breoganii]OCH73693.1 C4-dicarboxylate ABC transporter permease [Vibrio breoganii]OED98174.1 C4-dicarboxylate ABC transporter permease [Vibrio breoganii ZF-29]OEF85666.1 C4-dicarboxylate ABC transporter permease [Vibrio breoganii 1C10]PMG79305.1 C4-dicarboxylate ABC transporter permease [Vibrio breoganii]
MIEHLLNGLLTAFSPAVLPILIFGVVGGIVLGALPGLTATMGVAILLPFTFGMEPTAALVMLIGVYIGGIYGGSIAAILLKTPGTPASAATVLDGHTLAAKGQAARALSISAIASFVGGLISTIVLIAIAPLLANFALRFNAPEYFALALFGLTIIASVSAQNILKGLLAGTIGLLISTVGLDPISSVPRFTFGVMDLYSGINVIPVLIGLFALSEAINQIEKILKEKQAKVAKFDHKLLSKQDLKEMMPTAVKSGLMGTTIGSVPGAGADISAFVCYNEAKRSSKNPDEFGKGSVRGLAAAEAGNNGVTGGSLVPLLTLGVPGDAVAAVLLGALIVQGLTPGPLLFAQNPEVVYGVFSSMLVANIVMLIVGLVGIRFFCRIIEVPKLLMIPIIIFLSVVGAYAINNSMFDVGIAIAFGILGFVLGKMDIPSSPILLAIILGPMAETNLRKALLMYDNSWSFLYERPIALAFIVLAVFSVYSTMKMKKKKQMQLDT